MGFGGDFSLTRLTPPSFPPLLLLEQFEFAMSRLSPLPQLDQLPLKQGDPPNSAWGLWGNGPESALGALNYLTDEIVAKTPREEIKTGERVGLEYVVP